MHFLVKYSVSLPAQHVKKKTFAKPIIKVYCFESALLCQRNRSCVALKIRHTKHLFALSDSLIERTPHSLARVTPLMSVKSQCFRCEVKKGTKWSAGKKAEEGRRELLSSSLPTPLTVFFFPTLLGLRTSPQTLDKFKGLTS